MDIKTCVKRKKKMFGKMGIFRLSALVLSAAVVFGTVFFAPFPMNASFGGNLLGCRALASGGDVLAAGQEGSGVERHNLAPGVLFTLYRGYKNLAGEDLRVYVLEVDLNRQDVEILPVVAGDSLSGAETTAAAAARMGAIAGVNGGFYYTEGGKTLPVGNLIIAGEPWSILDYTTASAALSRFPEKGGKLEMLTGYFVPRTEVAFSGKSLPVTTINSSSTIPGVHLFTPRWGEAVEAAGGSLQVALSPAGDSSYTVTAAGTGRMLIPTGGLVLRFIGNPWRAEGEFLRQGEAVSLTFTYDQGYWGEIEHLITAGPLLVEEGEPVFQAIQEGFTGSVLLPNPRTAMGVTADNRALLVVAERSEKGSRVGLTLEEMSLLMAGLGAVRAIGLDGGGSSTFYAGGRIWNNARSSPRAVANSLLVLTGLKLYLNNTRIFPDVPPYLAEGGRTMVPIRVIVEHLGAQVEWKSETQTVFISGKNRIVKLNIGSNKADVDGVPVLLEAPPVIKSGRTMVPLRFVAENLQCRVHWDDLRRAVYIAADR